ncbi:MAG TPA: two-component regulator propeller domain-containing protein [Pyrinomonadaceae bacterium]|nr:two-component regulator propeller domain-containing protein [Pyrinomonadaceae bacterium]
MAFALTPKKVTTQYSHETWTTEDGLPQNSINDILQTRDGYLWLATFGGLVRFDGAQFVVFDRSIEDIKSQRIKALYEDKKGTLWASTEEGMLIRYRDGKFTTYTLEDRLPLEEAFRIEEDDESNLWITGRGVVVKFDGENLVSYRRESFAPNVHDNDYYLRYKVWWNQDAAELHCFVKGRMQTYSLPELSNVQIINVDTDHNGNLWIQTKGAGVFRLHNEQLKRYTAREGLPSNDLTGFFLEDRRGNLWVADHQDHSLYRIKDGKNELILRLAPFSLSALYEDREGTVWIGTTSALYQMRESAITLYSERDGLSWNWTYSILQDRAGAVWIGTWGGGVNKYENGHLFSYQKAEGLPSNNITCIYQDHSGRLLVGANGGVSYFYNGRFKPFDDKYGFLKRDVWAIQQDRAGDFWFGTDAGLVKLKDGNFTEYTTKDGLSHNVIRSLFEDHTGTLWIGTDQGLTRMRNGIFAAYTEREGFIGNQVRAIHEDNEGVLWVGTYDGGLYRLRDEQLTRFTTKDGLHDNGVFGILEDEAGNLWMSCNRGIYRVSRRELNDFAEGKIRSVTSVVYGTKDGLETLECNGGRQPSSLKTNDNKLWFPTMGGVAVIDPSALQINLQPPPVIIEEFRSGNETIDSPRSVEIAPNQDSFEIRYTAPSFVKPEYVKFKYKLEGLDNDWVGVGTRRVAYYNYVPPGEYTFTVIAANSDGVWNQTGRSVHIIVVPYWWERRWVQASMILIVLLALFSSILFWYRRRAAHLAHEHALQREFSRRLIASIDRERKRIADDLHNEPKQYLFAISKYAWLMLQGPNGLTTTFKSVPEDTTHLAVEYAREIETLAQRAGVEMKSIIENLRPTQLKELRLTAAIEDWIARSTELSAVNFSCDIDSIDGVFGDEDDVNIYRMVQECISNIIKHSQATDALINIKRYKDAILFIVKDNGKGFVVKESNRAAGGGFGLKLIEERAKMMGGKAVIKSAPGCGTQITIKLMLPRQIIGAPNAT